MTHYSKRIFILCFLFFSVHCFAITAAQQLANMLDKYKTVQAKFVQKTLGKKKTIIGTMVLARPGKFRWDITKPSKQSYIADGKILWIYDADLQQVTKQAYDASKTNSPAAILSGDANQIIKLYNVSVMKKKSGELFDLIPKQKDTVFQRVKLLFTNKTIKKMAVKDNIGQSSVFTFRQVKVNQPINPSRFRFRVPRGVDVISQ